MKLFQFRTFVTKKQRLELLISKKARPAALRFKETKEKVKTPKEPEPISEATSAQPMNYSRTFWYNDSHLLASAIQSLFQNSNSKGGLQNTKFLVDDLISRHKATTTPEVFGIVLKEISKHLLSEKQVNQEIAREWFLQVLGVMKTRKKALSEQGLTTALSALFHIPDSFELGKELYFGHSQFDMESAEWKKKVQDHSILHTGLFLRLCAHGQQYNLGMNVLKTMLEVRTELDIQFLTNVFALFTLKPFEHADNARYLYSIVNGQKPKTPDNLFPKFDFQGKPDIQFIAAYVRYLNRVFKFKEASNLIGRYFKKEFQMTPEVLKTALQTATGLKHPALANEYLQMFKGEELDIGCKLAHISVYIQTSDANTAWSLFESYFKTMNPEIQETGLRICSIGKGRVWYERAQTLTSCEMTTRGMINYLYVLGAHITRTDSQEGLDIASQFILKHRFALVDSLLPKLELKIISKTQLNKLETLELRGIDIVKKIASKVENDVQFEMILRRIKEIEALVPLIK